MEDYCLFSSKSCPYAHRCEVLIDYLNLTDIKIVYCDPIFSLTDGWRIPDNVVVNFKYIKDIYLASGLEVKYYTLPLLYNLKTKKIVANDSLEILKLLTNDTISKDYDANLYNDFNEKIVVGTYKAGHAKTEEEYKKYSNAVFRFLDDLETKITIPEKLSLLDIVMYCHLIRFEHVFYSLFTLVDKHIWEYCAIYSYLQYLYCLFKNSTDFLEIKRGAYLTENNRRSQNFPYLNNF